MEIRYMCKRCGRKLGEVSIQGGSAWSAPASPLMANIFSPQSRCPHCGGSVQTVQGGQKPTGEFQISLSGMIKSLIISAGVWAFFSFIMGVAVQQLDGPIPTDETARQALANLATILPFRLCLIGAGMGGMMILLVSFLASRRNDLDEPTTAGAMPFGQAACMMPLLAVGLAVSIGIAIWLIPKVAPTEIHLRSTVIRMVMGAFQGLLASTWTHKAFFKMCRHRLPVQEDRIMNY